MHATLFAYFEIASMSCEDQITVMLFCSFIVLITL
jgi:hypothetical protein